MWYNKKPVLAHIKIWGCPAYMKRISLELNMIDVYLWDIQKKLEDITSTTLWNKRCLFQKHATFLEKEFLLKESSGIEPIEV